MKYLLRWQKYDSSITQWDLVQLKAGKEKFHERTAAATCQIRFDYTASDDKTFDEEEYWLEFATMPATVTPIADHGKRFKFQYNPAKREVDLFRQ